MRCLVATLVSLLVLAPASSIAESIPLSEEKIGNWRVTHLEDQLDGTSRWIASADSADKRGSLVLKCDGGEYRDVYVVVLFDDYLGSRESSEFIWRVDKENPVTEKWDNDRRAAVNLDHRQTYKLAVALRDGKVFRARARTHDFSAVDTTIPIDGARAALKKVYQGCGDGLWTD